MADFHQVGMITTLHNLYQAFNKKAYLSDLEKRLENHAKYQNLCLLLPSLYMELENSRVLDNIVDNICKVPYLHCVVVALARAQTEKEFIHALKYFGRIQSPEREVRVVWLDGPRIKSIFSKIKDREISIGVQGKGQDVWMALGYIFARNDCEVIALHDCDIVTYDRLLLGRLFEPIANPYNDFHFCKGYYARVSPSEMVMKGRVSRIFIAPFIDTMVTLMYERGYRELERFFRYNRTFKYPLSGEFSFTTNLARSINVAYDWGLEVATLSQVYDQLNTRKIVQIDIAQNYEHRHQDVSLENADRGLHRMVIDISKFYLTYMRSHGVSLNDAFVDMMLHTYYQNALRFIRKYSYDAEINNLHYDLYDEEALARFFRGLLWTAWVQSRGPHEAKLIPSWNRIFYCIPDIYTDLLQAVESDNSEAVS
jgi:glucosyl-3-phosphoglycerate synthase